MHSIGDIIILLIILYNLIIVILNLYFLLYEEKYTKNKYNINSIDDIIFNSILLIFEISLVSFICSLYASNANPNMYNFKIYSLISFCSAIKCIIIFIKKRKEISTKILYMSFSGSIVFGLGIWSIIKGSILIIYLYKGIIALLIFTLIYYCTNYKKRNRNDLDIGILIMIYGTICMGSVLFLGNINGNNIYVSGMLILSCFLVTGFYIHYCKLYNFGISQNMIKMQKQNREIIMAEKCIERLVYINQDTGLSSLFKLKRDINKEQSIKSAFIITFDGLPQIINLFGYKECLRNLKDIGKIIKSNITDLEDIYSTSDNKFIITSKQDIESAKELALIIIESLREYVVHFIELDTYIGLVKINKGGITYDNLISELEIASDYAKKSSSSFCVYEDEMFKDLQLEINMNAELKVAAKNNDWDIYLQPKIDVDTNRVIGAEALIRWKERENISPQVFIPLAEKLGIIGQIGEYVISTTFMYSKFINDRINDEFNLSINLSCYQLMDNNFVELVLRLKEEHNINPNNITFELTESVLINNFDVVRSTIQRLKSEGFKFSLDDFGTGYSSLSYLSRLEFDEVKFDRSFTNSIINDDKNRIILEQVSIMASKLGLEIVSEGVENKEQLNMIKKIGCNYYQGYYYSRPIVFNKFIDLLNS